MMNLSLVFMLGGLLTPTTTHSYETDYLSAMAGGVQRMPKTITSVQGFRLVTHNY